MRRAWLALLLAACGEGKPAPKEEPGGTPEPAVPERVVYDQILVAYKGSYQVRNQDTGRMELKSDTERPREAAEELARRVYDLARSGSDFEALKREYTDARDKEGSVFGPIHAVRDDVRRELHEIYRSTLYPGPAAVIFGLGKGEVGLVEQDPKRCPDGWLIVKRLK